jgi:hypothetical protein
MRTTRNEIASHGDAEHRTTLAMTKKVRLEFVKDLHS